MNTVDRIFLAYSKTRKLTGEQADLVRRELAKFIDQLREGNLYPSNDGDDGPLKSD